MNNAKRVKLLRDIKKLLDGRGIEFFPIYDTLLGFIRGEKILHWDKDIDLGAWHYDFVLDRCSRFKYKRMHKDFYLF